MLFAKINHAQNGRASSAPSRAYPIASEEFGMEEQEEEDSMGAYEAYMQGGQAAASRPAMA
jgi:hypothetical protein